MAFFSSVFYQQSMIPTKKWAKTWTCKIFLNCEKKAEQSDPHSIIFRKNCKNTVMSSPIWKTFNSEYFIAKKIKIKNCKIILKYLNATNQLSKAEKRKSMLKSSLVKLYRSALFFYATSHSQQDCSKLNFSSDFQDALHPVVGTWRVWGGYLLGVRNLRGKRNVVVLLLLWPY